MAALFTMAKIRKQPKCPSVDEWIKMWYIYNGILLNHIMHEILPLEITWMDTECIMLSEIRQRTDKYHMT